SAGNLLITNKTKYASALTGAASTGTYYRLRVDSLDNDGSPPSGGHAHKAYAVRVVDTSGALCTTCGVSSWNDMSFYTPIATASGTTLYNGHWVEMLIPIPNTYSPGTNTTWCLQYVTSTGVVATDTMTAAVGVEGNPAHLCAPPPTGSTLWLC